MNFKDLLKKIGNAAFGATPVGQFVQGVQAIPQAQQAIASNPNSPVSQALAKVQGVTDKIAPYIPITPNSNFSQNLRLLSQPDTAQTWQAGFKNDVPGTALRTFTNRYIAPVAQIPYNARLLTAKTSTPAQRLQGGLGVAGGVASAIPGIDDIAFAGYDFTKGYRKGYLDNPKDFKGMLSSGVKSLSGEQPVGLGEAITKDPTVQNIGNLAELPLILMAGKVRSVRSGFSKDTLERAADEFSNPEVRNLVGKFGEIVETSSGANRKNMGKVGEYVQALGEELFGSKETDAMTNKQLKNAIDLVMQEADRINTKQPTFKRLNLGLTTENVRQNTKPTKLKERGFVTSVKEATGITEPTQVGTQGTYAPKPNEQLMGEAKALLSEGATIDFKHTTNLDQKVAAAIQEAVNLDQAGSHEAAANLFNNLSTHATELGRGVQAFSLLDKMSPEAISLSAAGKIKKYNLTASRKIPELTGEQQQMISDSVAAIRNMTEGREKNIAIYELNNKIKDFIPSSVTDKAITVWKAGLLTSLRTHERNIVGNTIMQGAEILKDPIASMVDLGMSLKTGKRSMTTTLSGMGEFASKKTGLQVLDKVKLGFDPSQEAAKFEVKRVNWNMNNPAERFLKHYTDATFNVLGAADTPFYNASFARSLYDQAGTEAINAGQRGNRAFIENLVKNPTEQMLTTAVKDAENATFKDKTKLASIAQGVKKSLANMPGKAGEAGKVIGEMTMPFTGVPSSVVGKTAAYSPIGLVKGAIDVGKVVTGRVPELQRQAAQEVGRGVVGTGLFSLGAYLMSKGLMTGQPKDATEANQWQLEGKQANSVLIGGEWRAIGSVGPQTLVVLAGAKYKEEMSKQGGSLATYGLNLGKDQLAQTFVQGMSAPLNALTDPNRYGKSYVGSTASSVIPNIVKDASRAVDPNARETNTVTDYMKSGIPGMRNTLQPKRDVLGNVIPQEPTGKGAFVDLFNSKTPIHNTITDELARLNAAGANATPSKLKADQTIKGVKVTLTPEELNSLEAQTNPPLTQALTSLITGAKYQSLDDEGKAKAIDDVVTTVRKQVRATADVTGTPNMGYVKSKDAPNGLGATVGTYGKSLVTDPVQTIKAVMAGNPIRKVEGGAVVLERQQGLGSMDNGNQLTEVDHKIALSLGGTNDQSNLQVLSKEDNQIKGQVEVYLGGLLKNGQITKAEAQRRDTNWRDEIANLPKKQQQQLVTDLSKISTSSTGKVYQVVSDSGNVQDIDLSKPIEAPQATGLDTLDKKLTASYKSALTTRINNIVKVYKDGQITADEANTLINDLTAKTQKAGSSTKKPKKLTIKGVSFAKSLKTTKVKPLTLKRPRISTASLKPKTLTYRKTKALSFKGKAMRLKKQSLYT